MLIPLAVMDALAPLTFIPIDPRPVVRIFVPPDSVTLVTRLRRVRRSAGVARAFVVIEPPVKDAIPPSLRERPTT